MAKARSPRYPAIGLGIAIEKVSAIYNKDVQNPIPREVAARHAGYNGITGMSLSMLSSLLKYGLLTGRGDNTSVSDLALQIIAHPAGSEERRAAILEAAFSPELFAEIRDHYKGSKVSDQALRAYLLTRKFLPSAVDGVIRAYRETMDLVETEAGSYTEAPEPERKAPPMPAQPATQQRREPQPPHRADPPERSTMRVALTENRIEVEATLIDVQGIDRLIKALQMNRLLLEVHTEIFDPVTETWSKPSQDDPQV